MKTTNEAVEVAAGGFHDLGVIFSRDIMGDWEIYGNITITGQHWGDLDLMGYFT